AGRDPSFNGGGDQVSGLTVLGIANIRFGNTLVDLHAVTALRAVAGLVSFGGGVHMSFLRTSSENASGNDAASAAVAWPDSLSCELSSWITLPSAWSLTTASSPEAKRNNINGAEGAGNVSSSGTDVRCCPCCGGVGSPFGVSPPMVR